MINQLSHVSLYQNLGTIARSDETKNSFVLSYPCKSVFNCTPYVLDLKPSTYKFECWGSTSSMWSNAVSHSTPGYGAYTSGVLHVRRQTKFYVYIGTIGTFNAMRDFENVRILEPAPGGATDVRLSVSENWWDKSTLISRIMVAAGAGAAEWKESIGGNGGGLKGGSSLYDTLECQGATQTSGSNCSKIQNRNAVAGEFGSAGVIHTVIFENSNDYGAIGGGGYYGGTSYELEYSASGGSSFISGYEGYNAVKNNSSFIEHTGDSVHYSRLFFFDSEMIPGNQTMSLPHGQNQRGIHKEIGAFRLTLVQFQNECTQSNHKIKLLNVFFLILINSNQNQ